MAYTDAQLAGFLRKCRAANRKKETASIEVSEPNLKCAPKTLSAEQMEHFEQVIRPQRIEREKGGWRSSVKWLEENYPEDFKEPIVVQPSCGTGSSSNCPNSEPTNEPATLAPQPLAGASESVQKACEVLSTPSAIPLPSAFWQALLYGSPDALLSPADANAALRLVAHELSTDCNGADFVETVRVGVLRKPLLSRFGAKVWDVMNKLWRSAPLSLGAPTPNEDHQSHYGPGAKDCPCSIPAWRREFHQERENEQRLLEKSAAGAANLARFLAIPRHSRLGLFRVEPDHEDVLTWRRAKALGDLLKHS